MSNISPAYTLARHLHDCFYGNNDILSEDEIDMAGVVTRIGSSSSRTSQRIEAEGFVGDDYAKQTLAKDKNGNYHLATNYTSGGRPMEQFDFRPNSRVENIEALMDTVFMHRLIAIAINHIDS